MEEDKKDSIRISRTAKGIATWDIKIRSDDLTNEEEQQKVRKHLQKIWNDLKSYFPT